MDRRGRCGLGRPGQLNDAGALYWGRPTTPPGARISITFSTHSPNYHHPPRTCVHPDPVKEDLINTGAGAIGALLVALITWWITERSRNKSEAAKERAVAEATLGAQADALILAVAELQAAAMTNRIFWEGPAERARSLVLALMAAAGGYARSDPDGPEWRRIGAAFGEVGRVLGSDRIATKTAVSTVKVELGRLVATAVPLMRHPDGRVRTATEHVIDAAAKTQSRDQAAITMAMHEFGAAVRAVLPSWSPEGAAEVEAVPSRAAIPPGGGTTLRTAGRRQVTQPHSRANMSGGSA